MTEEETRKLQEAYRDLKEQAEQKDHRIEELEGLLMGALLRIEELERRLGKDSHNRSKPPSSDGLGRKPSNQRRKSDKSSGGQTGHQGHTLMQVMNPDQIVLHRPTCCDACQFPLEQEAALTTERRQVHDLPPWHLVVVEHCRQSICCPCCHHVTQASFPREAEAPVQYGPQIHAFAVYLSQFQLLPLQRTCEALADLCGCQLSEGTLVRWITQAAKTLEPSIERIKSLLLLSPIQHADETGMRVKGILHWMHLNATGWLTLYSWHRKRGHQALEHIGIWPRYQGRSMHDRWSRYDRYPALHSLCGAHLLRDCLFVAEQEHQPWGQAMVDLLLAMKQSADHWRHQGAHAVPPSEREQWLAHYFALLATGFASHAAQAPPAGNGLPKRVGRKKQEASKNLLDALLKRADQVLGFLEDLSVPFTNNLGERDLRMVKVQQKISGTFRSEEGATAFCTIRSYLSTMRKQGRSMLAALTAVFIGTPFPIAWATE
jgi:transposase